MLSLPISFISAFIMSPMFWLGYAICVLFPIPFLNSSIISLWSKFGSKIINLFSSTEATIVTTVENTVATDIANTITTKL